MDVWYHHQLYTKYILFKDVIITYVLTESKLYLYNSYLNVKDLTNLQLRPCTDKVQFAWRSIPPMTKKYEQKSTVVAQRTHDDRGWIRIENGLSLHDNGSSHELQTAKYHQLNKIGLLKKLFELPTIPCLNNKYSSKLNRKFVCTASQKISVFGHNILLDTVPGMPVLIELNVQVLKEILNVLQQW